MPDRLQKILSRAGVASRRAAEQFMLEGRVTVNGMPVRELGTKADPAQDDIRVDGRRIRISERRRYLLMNKPRGYVTTRQDPQGRPTVIDLLQGSPAPRSSQTPWAGQPEEYVYPVGRLDYASEGLLILTNDGDLAAALAHPRHGVARTYDAQVAGVPDEHDLERLRRGVMIEGGKTRPADVRLVVAARSRKAGSQARLLGRRDERTRTHFAVPRQNARQAHATVRITIREGRTRQVRRMFDAIGHPVDRLRRIAIGPIHDNTLRSGEWRELSNDEVKRLRAAAVIDPGSSRREIAEAAAGSRQGSGGDIRARASKGGLRRGGGGRNHMPRSRG